MGRASLKGSTSSPSIPVSPSSPSSEDDEFCLERTRLKKNPFYEKKKKGALSTKSAHKLRDMVILLKDNSPFASACYKKMPRPNGCRTRRPLTNDLLAFCRAMVNEGLLEFKTALEIYPNHQEKLWGVHEMDFSHLKDDETLLSSPPRGHQKSTSSSSRKKSPPSSSVTTPIQSPESPMLTTDNHSNPSSPISSPQSSQIDFNESPKTPPTFPFYFPCEGGNATTFLDELSPNSPISNLALLEYSPDVVEEEMRVLQQASTNYFDLESYVSIL